MRDDEVLIGLTQHLLLAARRAGVSTTEVLDEVGIDEKVIANRDGRIPLLQHRSIGEAILRRLPGRHFVSLVAEAVTPSMFGVVGQVMENSATFRDALNAFIRYQRVVVDGLALRLEPLDGGAVLVARVPAMMDALRHPVLAMFATCVALGRVLTGAEWAPISVTFALPAVSGEGAVLQSALRVVPTFGADRHAMHLDRTTLALPIPGARPEREVVLRAYVDSLLDELSVGGTVADDVCRQLAATLPRGEASLEVIARRLGMSTRTLSRRLRADGTNLSELCERVRRELAPHYLRDASLAVYEVAFLLG